MVIAADYPFMDVLWSMLIFFYWVIWIWIVITVLVDIFRRHDIGGWEKAAWVIFVAVLPWLGVLIYLIAQHDKGCRSAASSRPRASSRRLTITCVRPPAAERPPTSPRPRSCSTSGRNHTGGVRGTEREGTRVGSAGREREGPRSGGATQVPAAR